jgi:hypothetical protein
MEELSQWLFQLVVWFAIVASRGSVFLLLLVLTVVVELAAAWIVGVRDRRGEKAVIWVNVLTNPAVVWILVVAGGLPGTLYWTLMGVLEILVVVVEWRLLRWAVGLASRRAALTSVVMNASSFAVGLVIVATVTIPVGLELQPSARERSSAIASLVQQVKAAFGDDLGSVEVRYGMYQTEPTYFGTFTLKGIPLEFRFQPTSDELDTSGLSSSALVDNSEIGGAVRFVQLARRFHADFPNEASMYYRLIMEWQVTDKAVPEPIAGLLEGRKGPSVVVFDRNSYWVDGTATSLGVYSWDPVRQDWDLVSRGTVPDF